VTILNVELGWIDLTSLSVLLVFGIMGLFRGFLWQTSRIACLVIGYVLATVFANDVAAVLERTTVVQGRVAVYSAYLLIFVTVLLLLNFVTLILDRLIKKLELTFYDRLGGGVLGVATGGVAVVAVVGVLYLITPSVAPVVADVRASHTGRFSRFVASWLPFPDDIAALYTGPKEDATEQVPGESGGQNGAEGPVAPHAGQQQPTLDLPPAQGNKRSGKQDAAHGPPKSDRKTGAEGASGRTTRKL